VDQVESLPPTGVRTTGGELDKGVTPYGGTTGWVWKDKGGTKNKVFVVQQGIFYFYRAYLTKISKKVKLKTLGMFKKIKKLLTVVKKFLQIVS
jgi:hypothetical protein